MVVMTYWKANQRSYDHNRTKTRISGDPVRPLSKFAKHKFLTWDGEGLETGKEQVYGVLANCFGDYIYNPLGLATTECLDFLLSDEYSSDHIHAAFGSSYDVNMVLKDVPEKLLRKLHEGDEIVRWRKYGFEYRPRKSFKIIEYQKGPITDGYKYHLYNYRTVETSVKKVVTLWDTFGFFQKKFLSVLSEWTEGTRFEDTYRNALRDIEKGKGRRGSFTEDEIFNFVLPYCILECQGLRDIMEILWEYLDDFGLVLSRWDGAGAVAAALMSKYEIKKYLKVGPKLEIDPTPKLVTLSGEYAYFGGWIETFKFGHIEWPIYHYDLRSAYPAALEHLPALAQGTWKSINFGEYSPIWNIYETIASLPSYWIAHVEWECPDQYLYEPGPFSWRSKKGYVTRPLKGRGWQWSPEILAAMFHCPGVSIKIRKLYYFVPSPGCAEPFNFVRYMYDERARLKAAGIGMEKVFKLGLNSLYGKLAQSLGYNEERGMKPPYHSIILAGLVTSITRAKILQAVRQKPRAIISIATDGIYSLEPLDLDKGTGLGQWEFTSHKNMTIVQSGFYWYELDGKEKAYYRGFNEDSIKRQQVIDAYKSKNTNPVPVETTRFVTLGAAIGLNNFEKWRKWPTETRYLDLWMQSSSKRFWAGDVHPMDDCIFLSRNRRTESDSFISYPDLYDSSKYEFDWDDDLETPFGGLSAREFAEEMFHQELSVE